MRRRHGLTDDQWELIKDIFGTPAKTGRPTVDRRLVVDGIFWILRTGTPQRDLPERFRKWGTVNDLFRRWSLDGTLDQILRRLRGALIDVEEIDNDLWCGEGTNVGTAGCTAGAKKRGLKSPLRATRHYAVLAAVLAQKCICFATQRQSSDGQRYRQDRTQSRDTLMDRINEALRERKIIPVIPSNSNEDQSSPMVDFDKTYYRRRSIVEQLTGWLKECRWAATRYKKRAGHYLSMIILGIIGR